MDVAVSISLYFYDSYCFRFYDWIVLSSVIMVGKLWNYPISTRSLAHSKYIAGVSLSIYPSVEGRCFCLSLESYSGQLILTQRVTVH